MKILKNKDGSTSVLIIMFMVVLMMFGIAILSTTLSNQKLSEKKQEWVNDYYNLESKVALELAIVDHEIQSIKEAVALQAGDVQERTELFKNQLREMDSIIVEDGRYLLDFSVDAEYGEYSKYIDVRLEFALPNEEIDQETFLMEKNYTIVMYSETQDLFEYKDIEYGVPFAPEE